MTTREGVVSNGIQDELMGWDVFDSCGDIPQCLECWQRLWYGMQTHKHTHTYISHHLNLFGCLSTHIHHLLFLSLFVIGPLSMCLYISFFLSSFLSFFFLSLSNKSSKRTFLCFVALSRGAMTWSTITDATRGTVAARRHGWNSEQLCVGRQDQRGCWDSARREVVAGHVNGERI